MGWKDWSAAKKGAVISLGIGLLLWLIVYIPSFWRIYLLREEIFFPSQDILLYMLDIRLPQNNAANVIVHGLFALPTLIFYGLAGLGIGKLVGRVTADLKK